MYLTHLSLTNFRSFARLDVEVPRGVLLLVGANAQGKTSLLEAIYFLATFVSFNAGSDRELINFLAAREKLAVARIVADFCRQKTEPDEQTYHRLEVRIIQEDQNNNGTSRLRKEVLLDGLKYKISELVGQFNAVLFLPQTLRIVEGPPEERRRYLNLTLAQVWPHYATHLSEYNRVLAQRNALLKQISERSSDPAQLVYWDELLAASGAELIYARIHAIQELEKLAAIRHHELTAGQEILRLSYQPAYEPMPQPGRQFALPLEAAVDRSGLPLSKIKQGFFDELQRIRGEEIARGVTTIGPHRDELRFLCNGVDLGIYGSRGQARSAVLSTKLAELTWMKGKSGYTPVFLLDEVLAELDARRRSDLLARLGESEQALLTTTDLDLFPPEFVARGNLWQVQNGQLVNTR
ncbi:MAG: DNA replication/repair protein RecF [Anaerolineales bacterium]